MKFFGCIAVLALLFNLSTQIPEFHNCPSDYIREHQGGCMRIMCRQNADGTTTHGAVGCATYFCLLDTVLGWEEPDDSKVYPDCCGGLICTV